MRDLVSTVTRDSMSPTIVATSSMLLGLQDRGFMRGVGIINRLGQRASVVCVTDRLPAVIMAITRSPGVRT
jgi:hypothetical protein